MRCSSPTVSQRKTTAMSRRKQSNPKPLKPGEDSEWTTNEESVGSSSSDAAGKCDVKTEQHQPPSPSPRPSTAEPEDLPAAAAAAAAAADPPPKLRLNPNLATDPARWSPVDAPSPQQHSSSPPLPPPPPPATVITATATAAAAAAVAASVAASSSASSTSSSSSSSSSSLSAAEQPNHNVVTISAARPIQIFVCNPCGIRFSSLSTLDAHQTYYCSRRYKKDSESDDAKVPMIIQMDDNVILGNDSDSRPLSVEPPPKSPRTGKQYKCPHCSYSADKKVSLNRHMRMHSVSPVSVQSPPRPPDAATDPSVVDRYCQDCDIRFSNLGTYQAHKMHYCKTRHVVKPTPSGSPISVNNNDPSPTGLIQPTYLALPTNPVIVVPYALVQNASMLPPMAADPSPPTNTACIVLADGTLQPIAQALVPPKFGVAPSNSDNIMMQQLHHLNHHHHQRDDSLTPPEEFYSRSPKKEENNAAGENVKRPAQARPSSPLDLRLKRATRCPQQDDDGDGEEEKENRRSDGNVTDAEDIVCAPSIPCMIPSPSSSSPPPLSSDNRTAHRSHQQPSAAVTNGGVIQKPRTPDDGAERNGKFSVSSLLNNIKQESGGGDAAQSVRGHHNNNSNNNNNNNNNNNAAQAPTVLAYKPGGGRHNVGAIVAGLGSAAHHVHPNLINRVAAVLPYFTSDNTLRLSADPGMQLAHHQYFVQQTPSKCESCNIVFCKYENFLAHKKHYCASRPPQPAVQQNAAAAAAAAAVDADAADKASPEGSPGGSMPPVVTSPQSSKDSASPGPAVLKPPMIQFMCTPCGIRFSSLDNFATHQSYYCPNRMVGGLDDKSPLQVSRCPRCKMTVDAASLQRHQCPAANCWKCPVCDNVCTSASAAQKHLDSHNGIRAFVCTICQYKGNTLRGLRTHIRMHFNKRLIPDFLEEEYVSYVFDENSASSSSAADRNGLPKMIPNASQPQPTPPSPQDAAMVVDRQPHVKATAAAAAAVVVVSDDDDDDQKDVVVIKQEPVNGGGDGEGDGGVATGPSSSSDGTEANETTDGGGDQSSGGAKRGPVSAKYCKVCDISFNYLSTFEAHKRHYCRNSTEYKTYNAENAKTTATVQTT